MFKASFFTTNRRKLSKRVDGGLIIISANGLLQRTGDSVYPFRQDSNFFYLTGLNEPDFLLVMNGDEEFLVLPKRSFAEDIFRCVINCDEVAKISGINTILGNREGWQRIKEMQQSRKSVHTMTMPPRRVVHTDAFSTNPNRRYLTERLKRSSPATALVDLRPHLVSLRQVKQPEEITVMKEAIALTGRGLVTAKQQIRTGITGHELKATLDSVLVPRERSMALPQL